MTQPNDTQFPGNRWAAEQLWNVSLLPVSAPREVPSTGAVVVELPLPRPREPRRNAA